MSSKIQRRSSHNVPENYFKTPNRVLFSMGISIDPINNWFLQFCYFLYSVCFIGLSIYLFLILELAAVILNPNVDSITFGLSYGVTHILGAAKVTLFLIQKKSIASIMHTLQKGIFIPNYVRGGPKEYDFINEAIRKSNLQGYVFFAFAAAIISLRGLYAVLDSGANEERFMPKINETLLVHIRTMPYLTYFPFDSNVQPYYAIGFAYQIASTYIYGLFIGATDAILCGFMMHITAQFKILILSLHNLENRSKNKILKNKDLQVYRQDGNILLPNNIDYIPMLSHDTNNVLENYLKKIALHHQKIVNLCEHIENEICYLMLLQFLSSLFIICFQFYQLSSSSPRSIEFVSMVLYLTLMLYQLLNYCSCGNEVMYISETITIEIFGINWMAFSEKAKKYLLLIMMRAQRSSKFSAGKFAFLSYQTYMSPLSRDEPVVYFYDND